MKLLSQSSLRCARKSCAGISLLGILLTVLGIGLFAAIVVPRFYSRTSVTIDNAADLMIKDLRAAQQRSAIAQQAVQFEVLERGYRLVDSNGAVVSRLGSSELFERDMGPRSVFGGLVFSDVQLGPDRALAIDDHGLFHEAGSITLRFGKHERTIRIDPTHATIAVDKAASE